MSDILELDNVTYRFRYINASKAWNLITSTLSTLKSDDLKSIEVDTEGDATGNIAILGAVLSKINTPEFKHVQQEVLNHVTFTIDGQTSKLDSTNFDTHFNQYRSHLLRVLIAGVKFQFYPFFKDGLGFLAGTHS